MTMHLPEYPGRRIPVFKRLRTAPILSGFRGLVNVVLNAPLPIGILVAEMDSMT